MQELKPCPFCGGEARTEWMDGEEQLDLCWVECGKCGASTVFCGQPELAIDAWNMRAQTVFGMTLDEVRQMMKRDAERAERTCEFKPFKGPISDTDEEGNRQGVCSECSAYMHEQFRYCPNCGAKVVSE